MEFKVVAGWLLAYFVYLGIGGAIFNAIERPLELERCDFAEKYILDLLGALNQTDVQYNFTQSELLNIITNIGIIRAQGIRFENQTVKCTNNWDFASAFFFSGTVVTTIGYGHIYPTSSRSRIFCIFYALIGIPIFAFLFAILGRILSDALKSLSLAFDKLKVTTWIRNLAFTCTFAVAGLTFFNLIPAAIFNYVEKWGYFNSVYYTVITLTTIGFGDFVPGQKFSFDEDFVVAIIYKITVYFWILFGLAFMATYFNFMSERLKFQADRIMKKKFPDKDEANNSTNVDGDHSEEKISLEKRKRSKDTHSGIVEVVENESLNSSH